MKHEFTVSAWRRYYDQINILGLYLKDSQYDAEGNPPKFKITLQERERVEKEISDLMKLNDAYLDKCCMKPNEPLWTYDKNNEHTWASSEKFLFGHLLTERKHASINI